MAMRFCTDTVRVHVVARLWLSPFSCKIAALIALRLNANMQLQRAVMAYNAFVKHPNRQKSDLLSMEELPNECCAFIRKKWREEDEHFKLLASSITKEDELRTSSGDVP